MGTFRLTVNDIDDKNYKEKYQNAVQSLSKALGVSFKPEILDDEIQEKYFYRFQHELVEKWVWAFTTPLERLYFSLVKIFDLPPVHTSLKKAIDDEKLVWRGNVLFHPETGKPIRRKDWDKLVKAIERFLNRKLRGIEKKMVLESRALGILLSRMRRNQSTPEAAIRSTGLKEIINRERSWGVFTEVLGDFAKRYELSKREADQVYLGIDTLGEHITDIKWKTLRKVKLCFIDAIRRRESKQKVAQKLFDTCAEINKDWRRVVEYESSDNFNNAYLREETSHETPGEKIYFKRLEAFDDHKCDYCEKIKGKIALWSEAALDSDQVEDPHTSTAIWEGKDNVGRRRPFWRMTAGPIHPHCRGSWIRWYPTQGESGPQGKAQKSRLEKSFPVEGKKEKTKMINFYIPIEADEIQKARNYGKLVYRTDLPFKRNGQTYYRKGWILPEASKDFEKQKKQPELHFVVPRIEQEDLLDTDFQDYLEEERKKLFLVGAKVKISDDGKTGQIEKVRHQLKNGELCFQYLVDFDGQKKWLDESVPMTLIAHTDDKKIAEIIQKVTPETRKEAELSLFGGDRSPPSVEKAFTFEPTDVELEIPGQGKTISVKSYLDVPQDKISLVSEKGILDKPFPSWMPKIDLERFKKSYNRIQFTPNHGKPEYLLKLINDENDSENICLVPLHVLAALQDFCLKKIKAQEKQKNDNITRSEKEKIARQIELFRDIFSDLEKTKRPLSPKDISRLEREADYYFGNDTRRNLETGEWPAVERFFQKQIKYLEEEKINYKNKPKPLKTLGGNKSTWPQLNLHDFWNRGLADKWDIQRNMSELLKQKLDDMEVQYEEDLSAFTKGRETSYGDRGTKDTILGTHGVLVKRQNGTEIDREWINGVRTSLDELYGAFGSKAEMSRKWGLKISCAGETLQHARKAIGIFFPYYHTIGVSGEPGEKDFGFTLAHEFGHFMDYWMGKKSGNHYASDQYSSKAGEIAKSYRSGQYRAKYDSKYYQRTCECFARAMEQYFAEKTGIGEEYEKRALEHGVYMRSKNFREKVMPQIETWLSENEGLLKSFWSEMRGE